MVASALTSLSSVSTTVSSVYPASAFPITQKPIPSPALPFPSATTLLLHYSMPPEKRNSPSVSTNHPSLTLSPWAMAKRKCMWVTSVAASKPPLETRIVFCWTKLGQNREKQYQRPLSPPFPPYKLLYSYPPIPSPIKHLKASQLNSSYPGRNS